MEFHWRLEKYEGFLQKLVSVLFWSKRKKNNKKKTIKPSIFTVLPYLNFLIGDVLMDYGETNKTVVSASTNLASRTCQRNYSLRGYRVYKRPGFNLPQNAMHHPPRSVFAKLRPSFRQVVVCLVFYLGAGTLSFYLLKDQIKGKKTSAFIDAMYFCIVTMTTVGYGDLVPITVTTKLLACAFVIVGMILVSLILSKAADYLIEKQESLLIKALHISEEDINRSEMLKTEYKLFVNLTLILVLALVGVIVLAEVENMDVIDSFYCVCSTITTLGYGDKSFTTRAGRLFAVFWILTSTICLGQCLLYLAELYTEHRQQSLVQWVLRDRISYGDLEAADLDDDGVVTAAEFAIYKLREIGKIHQDDIDLVMKKFKDLDVDQSGTSSATSTTIPRSLNPLQQRLRNSSS